MTEPTKTRSFAFTYSDASEQEVLDVLKTVAATSRQEIERPGLPFLTPAMASAYQRMLVAWYSLYTEEIGHLTETYNEEWNRVRQDTKSDGRATKACDDTEVGKRINRLRLRL